MTSSRCRLKYIGQVAVPDTFGVRTQGLFIAEMVAISTSIISLMMPPGRPFQCILDIFCILDVVMWKAAG